MADKRNSNEKSKHFSIEDDYIELLNSVSAEDEYEDIYSDSSLDSSGDVYISKGRKVEDDNAVYITKGGRKYRIEPVVDEVYDEDDANDVFEYDADEDDDTDVRIKPKRNSGRYSSYEDDEDDVSDFEAKHGKRKKSKRNPFVKVLVVLLVLVLALGGVAYSLASSIVSNFAEGEEIEHVEDVNSLVSVSHVRNILLIGADKETGGSSRSDSIMIASINSKTGKITIVSILRDTHLDVPGYRESKINAAHSWGGPNLLIQTIEQNFGIKIDDYATINFEMFEALVDGIGGIEVDVSDAEASHMNSYFKLGPDAKADKVEGGENVHLNGYQALCYARIRKLDSDFYRTQRQQKIISAILADVKTQLNPAGVSGLIDTAKAVAPYIETTLSEKDVISLLVSLSSCMVKSGADTQNMLISAQLPFEGTWWYSSEWDGSSISIDLEENKQLLYNLLYEEQTAETTESAEE